MHLVAGRSVHKHDANFAEENLKHWANSELSDSTMNHVYNMLELCHHCVSTGIAAQSSYEIAVCLFTGGMVCWAFAKLRGNASREQYVEQVRRASLALEQMGSWRMCSIFGHILTGFEVPKSG
jgi:methionyl-tRNA synthetase